MPLLEEAAESTLRGIGKVVRSNAERGYRFPKYTAATTALAGFGIAALKGISGPAQELVTGSPTAIRDTASAWATSVFEENYNPNDRRDPYAALVRRGDLYVTPQYLYGRSVQGQVLGNYSGSSVSGVYNLDYGLQRRVRGTGRTQPVNGSLVFGQYNLRRR
jgi:hypothetical protein